MNQNLPSQQFFQAQLQNSEKNIVERVAIGMALECDRRLAREMTDRVVLPTGEPVQVLSVDEMGPALVFDVDFRFLYATSSYPEGATRPRFTLQNLRQHVLADMQAAIANSGALLQAGNLVRQVVDNPVSVTREEFAQLFRWRHLFVISAYRWLTVASMEMDSKRETYKHAVKQKSLRSAHLLAEYHSRLDTMKIMMALACTAPQSDWLLDMANTFTWVTCTPSFVLTRERSMTGALQAAAAASWYGLGVVDQYHERLANAATPISALDSTLALTALSLRFPQSAWEIFRGMQSSMEFARKQGLNIGLTNSLLASADLAIWSKDYAESLVSTWGLASRSTRTKTSADRDLKVARCFIVRADREYVDVGALHNTYFLSVLALAVTNPEHPQVFCSTKRDSLKGKSYSSASRALLRSNTASIQLDPQHNLTVH
ncbi:hypothetical protein [Paraburkholderia caribensis]|uniref:hypothetical protein n=1 Tax=Paraburkholderia caribensis TaxID=75105 RepID=UPI0034D18767